MQTSTIWTRLAQRLTESEPHASGFLKEGLRAWGRRPTTVLHSWVSQRGGPAVPPGTVNRSNAPRLLIHLAGDLTLHHGGEAQKMKPGQSVMVPAYATTGEASENGFSNILICPRDNGIYAHAMQVLGCDESQKQRRLLRWNSPIGGMELTAAMTLVLNGDLPDPLHRDLARESSRLIRRLLLGLLETSPETAAAAFNEGPPALRAALALISRRFTDSGLTVAAIAQEVGMHPVSLTRLSRQVTGRGIQEHLIEARLRMAEHLLADPQLHISQVADRSGFGTTRSLRLHFGATHNAPPSVHRRLGHLGK